jgi:RHS repeat-associated protein
VGSLRLVADGPGNVVKRLGYDSFGNILEDTNPSFTIPFGFAGGLHDRDTGLVRFGYRDYDPEVGRWTAKDPIGFAGGDTDLYGYVLNNPVNLIDPRGLIWEFHIRTGQLWHFPERSEGPEGAAEFMGEGFSGGGEGLNDPLYQLEENVGPILEGTWAIGRLQTNWTNRGTELPFSMRLRPEPGTDTFGRGGFIIHGGTTSEGCPIFDRPTRKQIGNSGDKRLRVVR